MIPLLAILLLAPIPASFGVASTPACQDRDALLRTTLDAWVAAWNSYDLDAVDRLFVADGTVTYFSSEKNGLIQGIDELTEHHRGFGFRPGGATTGSRLWLEDVEVRWEGSTAVVLAEWLFARAGSEGPPQRGPVSFVFVLRGGSFRILHAHFANGTAEG